MVKDLPGWAGFGNQLFFYLRAHAQRRRGVDYWLVRGDRATTWMAHFPQLRHLTIDRHEVRLADARDDSPWHLVSSVGTSPAAASWDDVRTFIETYLMTAGIFRPDAHLSQGVTLNVRRGDYFSDPQVRGLFSFDQIAYIDEVVGRLRTQHRRLAEIRVVSDDVLWCKQRLRHLKQATDHLTFVESEDPLGDFRTVACSRELIIMNSSFSIWAAYISNCLYGDNHGLIHAPAFGTRPFNGTTWPSIDGRWDIIRSIPGGWDS
ncbi:alpha-1,2-fucosyltransferase [Ornithinimicrobium sp. W1679]|uniref:alpha-1,2-fucosyltransferase n=1 Tax=Ornithinimicrobium sp. W1679 TaxID=3418770 RepID=UPI003CE9F757